MRLTLRTMLAYLDNMILDESEAQELGKRIEESDFAAGLVHRIRAVTRRLRLGAPSLQGRGMGLDPNTVSEYLESSLPPERVPEIEKICLESDVHLAEVASCHQILILVDSEPADVDPNLKERMYRLGAPDSTRQAPRSATEPKPPVKAARVDAPPIAHGGPMPPPATHLPPPVGARGTKPRELPDYLRVGQSGRWKPLAITLVLAFMLSAVALRAMGRFDASHPLLRLMGITEAPIDVAQAPDDQGQLPLDGDASDATTLTPGAEPSPADGSLEAGDAGGTTPGATSEPVGVTPTGETTDVGVPDGQPIDKHAEPGVAPGSEMDIAPEVDVPPEFPPTTSLLEDNAAAMLEGSGQPREPTVTEPVPAESTPPVNVEVGYVKLTDPHFVVRLDPANGEWYRLPTRAKLTSEDRLVVLPTYRPEVVLSPGIQVAFAGASSVRLSAPRQQGEPSLTVDYGRLLVGTAGVAGAKIHMVLGGRSGTATFADAASEMGVEVLQYLPPGTDPEVQPATTVVRIYTTIGSIAWQADGAEVATPIEGGQVRVIIGDQGQTLAATQSPTWMHGETLDPLERIASNTLESFVLLDQAVALSLGEQSQSRRLEIRSLSARCLAYLETQEPLVREFDDQRQRSYWTAEYDVLRQSIARGPASATRVRGTLERFCGDAAPELYRLLWGFSPQQLQDGGDARLVALLDHDFLTMRIFAYENLRRITGKTLLYRPEVTKDRRKSSLQDWRERLENGAIVYETPPSAAMSKH